MDFANVCFAFLAGAMFVEGVHEAIDKGTLTVFFFGGTLIFTILAIEKI